MSSVLFNIVINRLLRSLPMECGLLFGGGVIRAMAFVNDMNLIAETPQGLQALIYHSTAYLLQCVMKINQAKSHTVLIVGLGKEKNEVADVRQTFTIDGLPIRNRRRNKLAIKKRKIMGLFPFGLHEKAMLA